ncbi:MAG: 1-phosphofructokinase [Clostridia bacterium]|nr:1-phosphofructokinase [Clostridia bacterium]
MIYTVTCNPAVDYTVHLSSFATGQLHRPTHTALSFGGKGVNVSRLLTALGVNNRALGFVGGEVGEMLENGLRRMGLETDFIHLTDGNTRINVKIAADTETELNATGPAVDEAAFAALQKRVAALQNGDILCLCGSLPRGCVTDAYARLMQCVSDKAVRVVVDATGQALLATLPYCPYLIKPNRDELSAIVGRDLTDDAAIVEAARDLQMRGALNVLVSLGGDGALLLTQDGEIYRQAAFDGEVVSTVGAGDSMVAGFIAASAWGYPTSEALRFAAAAGGATAFCDGIATRDAIEMLLAKGE